LVPPLAASLPVALLPPLPPLPLPLLPPWPPVLDVAVWDPVVAPADAESVDGSEQAPSASGNRPRQRPVVSFRSLPMNPAAHPMERKNLMLPMAGTTAF